MERAIHDHRVKAALVAVVTLVLLIVVFRLGDRASAGVDLDEAAVWIENGLAGEVLQVNASSGEIIARVDVAAAGEDYAALPHELGAVVVNHTAGHVRLVDSALLAASDPLDTAMSGGEETVALGYAGADNVYLVDANRVVDYDPRRSAIEEIELELPVADAAIDARGRLLAIESGSDFVRRLGPNGLGPFATLPTDPAETDAPTARLVRAGAATFVLDPERLAVTELRGDGSYGLPTCITGSFTTMLVGSTGPMDRDDPHILVHNPDTGVLAVSNPATSTCYEIAVDADGAIFGPPVVLGDRAYLPNWTRGRIEIVDLAARSVLDGLAFASVPGERFELELHGSTVVANEPQGPFAAIVRGDDMITVQKLESVVVGTGTATDRGDGGATPLVASDGAEGGAQALGSTGDQVGGTAGDDAEIGDSGAIDPEVLGVAVENVERVEDPDALIADFRVSASTVAVGETIRFEDASQGNPVSWVWDFGDGTGATEPEVETSYEAEGVYRVQLSVADAAGRRSGASTLITVVGRSVSIPPAADFSFGSSTVEVGETLAFTSLTTGEADRLDWDFGDGGRATGTTALHAYDEVGVYTVTLTATNAAGSSEASTSITVVEPTIAPVAAMAPIPSSIEADQFLRLQSVSLNDPTSTRWDFGDGRTAAGTSVRHSWSQPGTYRIRLTVENSAGSDTTVADIRVRPRVFPPEARFTESTREALVGERIRFTDLSLNNPTSIEWDFGDGTIKTGARVSHRYSEPGEYRVTLKVANEAGRDRRAKGITIIRPVDPPVASFTLPAPWVPAGKVVSFIDTSANEPAGWSWDFGDGQTSTSPSPSHAYESPGTYTVRLTVTNESGTSTAEQQIGVFGAPVADFGIEIDGLQARFIDRSSNAPWQWRWDFSDGEVRTEQYPTRTFEDPGSYQVTLRATNDAGESEPVTRSFTLHVEPEARFDFDVAGLRVRFENRSENGPTSFLWDFDDGTTSDEENPVHVYDESGSYDVELTVSNPAGEDSVTRRVRVRVEPLEADFRCVRGLRRGVVLCDGSRSTGESDYLWSAPAALEIQGQNAQQAIFRFPPCGRYEITLEVFNEQGDSDSRTRNSPDLGDGRIPDIDKVKVSPRGDLIVELEGEAGGSPDEWSWTIPGGEIIDGARSRRPTVQFSEPGTYEGTVTASNDCGTSAPFTFTIEVVDPDEENGD